ncbi:MAG: carbamoyl-phosphate synthase large subunit [Actinobacteria bacterium]|nr:carbamoyl-phosphate synthase large subunit [Actinomycetota bacterium]
MPRREDIRTIMVLGSGPIVIGQAGEFDYSGTQGCRALRDEGYRIVLVNSNPATIMTDPGVADRTYVEPLDVQAAERIIQVEQPDAILPTLGGQTALNLAIDLAEAGVLDRHGVELIGADVDVIRRAEDRDLFKQCMREVGVPVLDSRIATDLDTARDAAEALGFPIILRPAFTLGGEGGGVALTPDDLEPVVTNALAASPISQVLMERSVTGWDEIELEVVRDRNDNAVIVCTIENLDPMGVHTGDSVTVAPAMTLDDREQQLLRDAAIEVVRAVGVETGGANVQFALNRATGEMVVIEMNPRVSRSSALASKATGFPIARIAARLAIGYTLDELPNDITKVTPASFEPTLDYVAVKVPRFAFEKLTEDRVPLSTYMQSVGEVLALGRTFGEALGKALSARELDARLDEPDSVDQALERLRKPSWDRFDLMMWAAGHGATAEQLHEATGVHRWFTHEILALATAVDDLPGDLAAIDHDQMLGARRRGLTDRDIAAHTGASEAEVGHRRHALGVRPSYRAVDTCAAEFAAVTPYYYGTFGTEGEATPLGRPSVVVLGSGPNRIGQGIEFDYCCVHAAMTTQDLGYAAIMVNCNPETVSTDHGVSDRLYMEPVTLDAVLDICQAEQPVGVIAQLGGQTPLRLAAPLKAAGVNVLGTSPEAIDMAEDRGRFGALLGELGLKAPPWAMAEGEADLLAAAEEVGYPALVRPSYVLGGRAMAIVSGPDELRAWMAKEKPRGLVMVDRFLAGATEIDVDALSDGESTWIAGVMEHVEEAGVHSGDSACVLPPQGIGADADAEVRRQAALLAEAIGVKGLLNVQFALRDGTAYVIEANPRASRTVPFVAKATGVPVVRHAVRLMLGESIAELGLPESSAMSHVAVKEAVLPFARFPWADPVLGPEMRSTGEVMGIGATFTEAFAKAQRGARQALPRTGTVFLSVRDEDKPRIAGLAVDIHAAGLEIVATGGTAKAVAAVGIPVREVNKISDGPPHVADLILGGEVAMVVCTPSGRGDRADGAIIRRAAVRAGVPCITTIEAAEAGAQSLGVDPAVVAPVALQDLARA